MDPTLFRIAHHTNVGLLVASSIEADRLRSGTRMPVPCARPERSTARLHGRWRHARRRLLAALGVN